MGGILVVGQPGPSDTTAPRAARFDRRDRADRLSCGARRAVPRPGGFQCQHALVSAACPGTGAVGEGGHVGAVDEHVDLVERGADRWLLLRPAPELREGVAAVAKDMATAARAERAYEAQQCVRLGEGLAPQDAHPIPLVGGVEQCFSDAVHWDQEATVCVPAIWRDASSYLQSGSIYRRALRDRWRLHVATRRRPFGDGDRSAKPVPALACVALRRPMQAWTGRGEIRRRTDRRPARRSGLPCGWRAGRGRRSPLATGLSRTAGTGR